MRNITYPLNYNNLTKLMFIKEVKVLIIVTLSIHIHQLQRHISIKGGQMTILYYVDVKKHTL